DAGEDHAAVVVHHAPELLAVLPDERGEHQLGNATLDVERSAVDPVHVVLLHPADVAVLLEDSRPEARAPIAADVGDVPAVGPGTVEVAARARRIVTFARGAQNRESHDG